MDVSLFSYFGPIFLFVLVFVVVYALLSVSKMFDKLEGKNGLYALLAITSAFFVLMFKPASTLITTMVPWFAALVILMFLIMFVVKMFNSDDKIFENLIQNNRGFYWILITIFIVIVIASLSSTFGQTLLSKQTGETVTEVNPSQINLNGTIGPEVPTIETAKATGASSNFGDNVLMTLVNPKVLGMILMLVIGMFTIMFMADSNTKV